MADQHRPRPRARRPASGLLRRFARAQDGAAAIEFAFVAIPFLVLVFSILELGIIFLVSMTLESGLANVDRKIRTGEFQSGAGTAATFKTAVCDQMSWLGAGCSTALTVDVRVMPTFADTSTLAQPDPTKACWDPGGPGSIVLVRAYYKWPIITPLLQSAVSGGSGNRSVIAASIFTNEPYSDTAAPAVTCPT